MPTPNPALDHLIVALGREDARSLVQLYLRQTSLEMDRLGTLNAQKQLLAVHSLKGSSFQLGAPLFGAQCRALETQLKHSDTPLSAAELTALKAGFEECAVDFKSWLAGPGAA